MCVKCSTIIGNMPDFDGSTVLVNVRLAALPI